MLIQAGFYTLSSRAARSRPEEPGPDEVYDPDQPSRGRRDDGPDSTEDPDFGRRDSGGDTYSGPDGSYDCVLF